MVDARGTASLLRGAQRDLLQELARADADMCVHNSILFQLVPTIARNDLRDVTASNHDRLVVVDGRFAVSGGRNLSKDYIGVPCDQPGAYIDMHVLHDSASTTKHLRAAFDARFLVLRTTRLLVEATGDGRTAPAPATMHARLADGPMPAGALSQMDDARAALGAEFEARVVGVQPQEPTGMCAPCSPRSRASWVHGPTARSRPPSAAARDRHRRRARAGHTLGRGRDAKEHREREPARGRAGRAAIDRRPEVLLRAHRARARCARGRCRPQRHGHHPDEQPPVPGQPADASGPPSPVARDPRARAHGPAVRRRRDAPHARQGRRHR